MALAAGSIFRNSAGQYVCSGLSATIFRQLEHKSSVDSMSDVAASTARSVWAQQSMAIAHSIVYAIEQSGGTGETQDVGLSETEVQTLIDAAIAELDVPTTAEIEAAATAAAATQSDAAIASYRSLQLVRLYDCETARSGCTSAAFASGSTSAASAGSFDGTNYTTFLNANQGFQVPVYVPSGSVNFEIRATLSLTAASTSTNYRWQVNGYSPPGDIGASGNWGTEHSQDSSTDFATASDVYKERSLITSASVSSCGLTPGGLCVLAVRRNGSDAADTYTGTLVSSGFWVRWF